MNTEAVRLQTGENPGIGSVSLGLIFSACFFAYVFCGVLSTLVSAYLPDILADIGRSQSSVIQSAGAFINAFYILGWAIGGVVMGYVGDRWGRVKTMAFCMVWLGLWTLFLPIIPAWQFLAFGRFMAGLGTGGVMVIAMTFLSEVWPQKTRTVVIGLVSVGFPIGIFSSGIITYSITDWKTAMNFGMVPILLALVIFITVKESGQWLSEIKNEIKPAGFRIFEVPNLRASTIIFGSMVIGLWAAFSWIPTWVQSLISDSDGQRERGVIMMLLGIFGVLGGSFAGWVVNMLGVKRALVGCYCSVILISFMLYGLIRDFTIWIYFLTAMLSFTFGVSQGLLSSFIPQLFPISIRAFATGISFNLGRVITAFAVFLIGGLVVFFGSYGNSLLFFSFIFIPGLIAALRVKSSVN